MTFVGDYVGRDVRRGTGGAGGGQPPVRMCDAPAKVTLRALLAQNMNRLGLTTAAVETLVAHARISGYRAGQAVFAPTDSDHLVHFLIRGAVRITCEMGSGTMTVRIVRPGQFFSLASLFDHPEPRKFGAVAHEAALVALISHEAMRQVLMALPPANALTLVSSTWRVLLRLLFDKCAYLMAPLRERVTRALELLAQDFGTPHERGVLIDLPLTHHDVAELAVASRANVSRCLSAMRREGRLDVEGRRFILVRH
ncbi:MAG TPA: Crp/Fnr family transcriptional regulator [Candidatus Binatia bacterium]|nr:Crp/Fnr family transcriptional regulator [Candidatus Binatia bacterium]